MSGEPHGSSLQKRRSYEQPNRGLFQYRNPEQGHLDHNSTWERQLYFWLEKLLWQIDQAPWKVKETEPSGEDKAENRGSWIFSTCRVSALFTVKLNSILSTVHGAQKS